MIVAAAMGRPLIGNDFPGCGEVVYHGVNRLVVVPRDAAPLAEVLINLCDPTPTQLPKMGHLRPRKATFQFDVLMVIARYRRIVADARGDTFVDRRGKPID